MSAAAVATPSPPSTPKRLAKRKNKTPSVLKKRVGSTSALGSAVPASTLPADHHHSSPLALSTQETLPSSSSDQVTATTDTTTATTAVVAVDAPTADHCASFISSTSSGTSGSASPLAPSTPKKRLAKRKRRESVVVASSPNAKTKTRASKISSSPASSSDQNSSTTTQQQGEEDSVASSKKEEEEEEEEEEGEKAEQREVVASASSSAKPSPAGLSSSPSSTSSTPKKRLAKRKRKLLAASPATKKTNACATTKAKKAAAAQETTPETENKENEPRDQQPKSPDAVRRRKRIRMGTESSTSVSSSDASASISFNSSSVIDCTNGCSSSQEATEYIDNNNNDALPAETSTSMEVVATAASHAEEQEEEQEQEAATGMQLSTESSQNISPPSTPTKTIIDSPTQTPTSTRRGTAGTKRKQSTPQRKAPPLPDSYKELEQYFQALDFICECYHRRQNLCAFETVKESVESVVGKDFYVRHLAQIKTVFPEAFTFELYRQHNYLTDKQEYFLLITPNQQWTQTDQSVVEEIYLQRRATFHQNLLAIVNKHADTLPLPARARLLRGDKTTLSLVPEIAQAFLPRPKDPTPKKNIFAMRKGLSLLHPDSDAMSHGDNKRPGSPMPIGPQRGLKRGMRAFAELSKQNVSSSEQRQTTENDGLAQCKRKLTFGDDEEGEEKTRTERMETEKEGEEARPVCDALKNVPAHVVANVRRKEEQRALEERDGTAAARRRKEFLDTLPLLCDMLRSFYVAEKKTCLGLDVIVEKVCSAYTQGHNLKMSNLDITNRLKVLCGIAPEWLRILDYGKGEQYLKVSRTTRYSEVKDKVDIAVKDCLDYSVFLS
ncbi:replication licensing factor Cdt1 [Balamuthia mandrillaris]